VKRAGRFSITLILCAIALLISPPRQAAGQTTLYVDGACSDSNGDGLCDDGVTYKTIQAAIDDAEPGNAIQVAAGVYVEQLQIDKDLFLAGTGPCTLVRAPESLTECPQASGSYPGICVEDASNVQIEDLSVDGAGNGNGLTFYGIGYFNAGGEIRGVEIQGIHDTPFGATPSRGVALYAHSNTPRMLTVTDCRVHDFHKNGMEFGGTGLTVHISHSTVTGSGPISSVVQNGVVVRDGAAGTVGPYNEIEALSFSPHGSASGVLIWFSNSDVLTNTVSNCQVGVYYWEASGRISGNTVVGSSAGVGTADYWGIIVSGPDAESTSLSPTELGVPRRPDLGDGAGTELRRPSATDQGMTLSVTGNTLAGGRDSTESAGVWLVPGAGTGQTSMTASQNHITGWADGVRIVQKTGVNLEVGVNWNGIAGNTAYGLRVSGSTSGVHGERNWWGDDSGPHPYGGGDAITEGVACAPWLVRTYIPVVTHDFASPPPYPDLRVTSVIVEPDNPQVGEPVTLTVEVLNTGPSAAGPFWVDLYDNPIAPPEEANQIWNWLCEGPAEDCYGIAWYVEEGLGPGESVTLSSLSGYEEPQTHWLGHFVEGGRHDIYAFADSWNRTVWYGAVREQNEGVDNRYGPVIVCVQPGEGAVSFSDNGQPLQIPPRPTRP